MVLLDKLVLELDRNGVLDMSARMRADSPTSSMMTPAPAEESRAVCSPTAISLWQLAEALPDDRGTESRAVCSPTAISLWQLAEALPDDRGTMR